MKVHQDVNITPRPLLSTGVRAKKADCVLHDIFVQPPLSLPGAS